MTHDSKAMDTKFILDTSSFKYQTVDEHDMSQRDIYGNTHTKEKHYAPTLNIFL